MKYSWMVAALACTLLSGCISEQPLPEVPAIGEPVCPTDSAKRSAYANAERFMERDIFGAGTAFAMTMAGTIEGEIDNILIKADPESESFYVRSSEGTVTLVGHESTYVSDEVEVYARDHNPDTYNSLIDELMADDEAGISFLDDLTVEDYSATCSTLGGTEVIEFRYDNDGIVEIMTVEAEHPNRPVAGKVVDPALQDNYRVSITYAVPAIEIDSSLDRYPIAWAIEADEAFMNERGGFYLDATLTDETEWAPFTDLEFHLVDGDGMVYVSEGLEDDAWDMGDGDYFEYRDKDKDGMLSRGDVMIMDLGPGLDIVLYDEWADSYATLTE